MGIFQRRKENRDRLLSWQKVLVHGSPDKLLYTEDQLKAISLTMLENCERVIRDSYALIKSTSDPEVYFSRYGIMLERMDVIVVLSQYMAIEVNGKNPCEAFDAMKAMYNEATRRFILRYISASVDKAKGLKTERGRTGRYQQAYDDLREYYHRMSEDNIALAERAFPGVKKGVCIEQAQ